MNDERSIFGKILLPLTALVFLLVVVAFLWIGPEYKIKHSDVSGMSDFEKFTAENNFRSTLATIFGGLILFAGSYVALRNLWVSERNLSVTQRGQITERFTRAIEQLGASKDDGSPRIEIRLGGIFGLEQIAIDDPERYHDTVMEVLSAYLRETAPWPAKDEAQRTRTAVPNDLQAIAAVIRRRRRWWGNRENAPLDLRRTDLRGFDLSGAHLERADLSVSCLDGADLQGASLADAIMTDVSMAGATVKRAILERADLTIAKLSHLDFEGVKFLGATLIAAHLYGADLSNSRGLTDDQIAPAHINDETLLPQALKRPSPSIPATPRPPQNSVTS